MLHKEFWGLLFLGFVFWVIAAASPSQRIENLCRPVGWAGNVVVSGTALVLPAHQAKVQGGFNSLEYGCRYMVWRLFYQDEYNKWLNATKQAKEPTAITEPDAAAKPVGPPEKKPEEVQPAKAE